MNDVDPNLTGRQSSARAAQHDLGRPFNELPRDPELAQRIADAVGRYAVVIAERTDVQPEQQA
ncbi:hypothetical protein [Burkholderia cepacia]|uniref:hypothetical protein n=1 Tax=Burkholderia cepacia TaxID=292 RepID=UPI002ABE36C9|nr:hypothetical protein [Burkholderia cepacia]